jgi:predicted DNA-binding transcriptional regulator AlpA
VSRSIWWEGVRTGRFPQAVKIGGVTAWRAEEIRALIAALADAQAERATQNGGVRL